ncbi:MAG: hypothetical protein JST92_00150 [Deltaproteobacteria bacterium]|nr:hypothetical protein [Deltaproteobacteria bacterium]
MLVRPFSPPTVVSSSNALALSRTRAADACRLAAAIPFALTLACAAPKPAPTPDAPVEPSASDRALLARQPLALDEALIVNDDALKVHAPAFLEALRCAAADEGFSVAARPPRPGDLVLHASFDWTPPGADLKPSLFFSLSLERDGARVNESSLRQAEGFPGDSDGMHELARKLVRPLARSARTRDFLQARDP